MTSASLYMGSSSVEQMYCIAQIIILLSYSNCLHSSSLCSTNIDLHLLCWKVPKLAVFFSTSHSSSLSSACCWLNKARNVSRWRRSWGKVFLVFDFTLLHVPLWLSPEETFKNFSIRNRSNARRRELQSGIGTRDLLATASVSHIVCNINK